MEYIPDDWWVENDGQRQVLDPDKVNQLLRSASKVIALWQCARLDHQPMIDELVHLRDLLRVDKT